MREPDVEEELASGPHASLVRTATDYRIVHRRAVESFPLTDEGSDDAWARYRSLALAGRLDRAPVILLVIAVGAAACWLALVTSWAVVTASIASDGHTEGSWVGTILDAARYQQVFFALFAGSLGTYVAWWFYRRGHAGSLQA